MIGRIEALLAPITSSSTADKFATTMPDSVIADVFRWARTNRSAQAIKGLTKESWPADQAQAFVASCANFPIYTAVCAWGLRREQPEGSQTLITVSDERRCWLLEPQWQGGDVLYVRSATGTECIAAFKHLAERLIEVAAYDALRADGR